MLVEDIRTFLRGWFIVFFCILKNNFFNIQFNSICRLPDTIKIIVITFSTLICVISVILIFEDLNWKLIRVQRFSKDNL